MFSLICYLMISSFQFQYAPAKLVVSGFKIYQDKYYLLKQFLLNHVYLKPLFRIHQVNQFDTVIERSPTVLVKEELVMICLQSFLVIYNLLSCCDEPYWCWICKSDCSYLFLSIINLFLEILDILPCSKHILQRNSRFSWCF